MTELTSNAWTNQHIIEQMNKKLHGVLEQDPALREKNSKLNGQINCKGSAFVPSLLFSLLCSLVLSVFGHSFFPATQFLVPATGNSGQMRSAAGYISPEALGSFTCPARRILCCKSDIWSAGCVLFELLTGRAPFDTGNSRKCSGQKHRRRMRARHALAVRTFMQHCCAT